MGIVGTILGSVLVTSLLSGVLGMGGGMILMGVFALILPVAQAMVLHGLAQLSANGSRALIHFRGIGWRILPYYVAGAALSLGVFTLVAFRTEKWLVYLVLGVFPFLAMKLKRRLRLSIDNPWHAGLCGLIVMALQLAAGASGPILDVFYLNTKMTRHQIVASKAVTQKLGHAVKLFYYGSAADGFFPASLPAWLPYAVVGLAFAGSLLGSRLLYGLTDATFQKLSRAMIRVLGAVYLIQGLTGFYAQFFATT
jgi:uncharacterized membrane protein YfcA